MFGARLLALALVLIPPDAAVRSSGGAEVVTEDIDVFGEPDASAFATGRLRAGDPVTIRRIEPDGWLAIEPPPGSFSWIDRDALEALGRGGRARVIVPRAPVRPGRAGARMPGPPQCVLEAGDTVRLRERPPLTLRQGRTSRTFQAIAPPAEEVRYVRAEGVEGPDDSRPDPPPDPVIRASRPTPRLEQVSRTFATPGPPVAGSPLPTGFATALGRVESVHRAALRLPVEDWRLDPIRRQYQDLLSHESDPNAVTALRARLDQVARQEEFARSAEAFTTLVRKSRARDRDVDALRKRLAATGPGARTFDAEGMLQASSKMVDGRKVFALIGPDGNANAYLNLPPGLISEPLLARRVGVRGRVRFDEDLRSRFIVVTDLEPLEGD